MARDGDDLQATHRVFHQTCRGYGGMEHPADLGPHNPPVSARQQRFMGAELARKRAGKKTQTGMSEQQLREFARKPKGGY